MAKPGPVLHACCLAPEDDPHAWDCPEAPDDSDVAYPRALADAYAHATSGQPSPVHAVQVGTKMHLWLLRHGFRVVRIR